MTEEQQRIAQAIKDSFHYQTLGVSKTEAKHVTYALEVTANRIAQAIYGTELSELDNSVEFLTACGLTL